MSKDQSQDKYKEVFQELKEEKMDWSFDDFLKKTEESPIIPIQETKPKFPKWFWMAASLVLVFGLGSLLLFNAGSARKDDSLVKNEILKQKDIFIKENNENTVAFNSIEDSLKQRRADSLVVDSIMNYSGHNVLDDVLPRKGRIKKKYKEVYVQNSASTSSSTDSSKQIYQSNYVIVNGKRIDDVKEALDVTRYSFQALHNNVNSALAQTRTNEDDY